MMEYVRVRFPFRVQTWKKGGKSTRKVQFTKREWEQGQNFNIFTINNIFNIICETILCVKYVYGNWIVVTIIIISMSLLNIWWQMVWRLFILSLINLLKNIPVSGLDFYCPFIFFLTSIVYWVIRFGTNQN